MPKRKAALSTARKYLQKWAPRMGFGHYRYDLSRLPSREQGNKWGRSFFIPEDEFFAVQVVEDGVLPEPAVEALIVHELAHGLIQIARDSAIGEELVCNRIARLVLGDGLVLPNEANLLLSGEWHCLERIDVEDMREAIDDLPERERDVVNRVFYERQSYGEVARDLGMRDATAVRRLVQKALRSLESTLTTGES